MENTNESKKYSGKQLGLAALALVLLALCCILTVGSAWYIEGLVNPSDVAEPAVETPVAEKEAAPAAATPWTFTPKETTATPVAEEAAPAASNAVIVNGAMMGVVDPQIQQTHAAVFYLATGVSGEVAWDIDFPEDAILIVGGFSVNGQEGGVYAAYTSSPVKLNVKDGFVIVTTASWAREEFCFRVSQAKEYGWAHNTLSPLSSWAPCEAVSAPAAQETPVASQTAPTLATAEAPALERRESGEGQTIPFEAGETVWGGKIMLDSDQVCDGGGCYLQSAPSAGSVKSGVVNPWPDELPAGIQIWTP